MNTPELNARQWILFYYEENDKGGNRDKYWPTWAREEFKQYSSQIKVDKEVRQIVEEETTGAKTDEQKLDRLFEYCRRNLKDVHGAEITTEEREKAKQNHNTVNTLRNREGTLFDIKLAFAALAGAAGYEAHLARLADRSQFFFDPRILSAFFLDETEVAVKVGSNWRFYGLGDRWVPAGDLPWQEQGVNALIEDPKAPALVITPLLPADKSSVRRIGTLKLSAEGTLEGDMREIYTGNKAVEFRNRFGLANDAERETALREQIKERFADFDLTGVKFAVSPDLSKNVGIVYHISVPNYVQRTGKRMFVNPGFFAAGQPATFVDNERKLPICFPYPSAESEYVELQLPEGYQLEHADAPAGVNLPPTVTYSVKMSVAKTNKLLYERRLSFGGRRIEGGSVVG